MTIARLADCLVHEAIHTILGVLEVSETFADHPEPPLPDVPVRSPWTNNEIPRRIYIHACFVWYGLAKFWKAARQTDAFPAELVNKYLAMALGGFRVADPVDRLLPYRDEIRPTTLEVIASLRTDLERSHDLDDEPARGASL
jgi:HEXXH motif-containing protein